MREQRHAPAGERTAQRGIGKQAIESEKNHDEMIAGTFGWNQAASRSSAEPDRRVREA
jgi:hypothetical protein